jgi:hypothetical protein
MSKERELLSRVIKVFDSLYSRDLINEIKELLAQPEQEPEPLSGKWWYGKGVEDTKYFLKREPLSDDEILKLYQDFFRNTFVIGDMSPTIAFAKTIEKAHGIRGVDHETV